MKNYIICAPNYSESNGIKVLYRLADLLNQKGFKAYMYAIPNEAIKCNYIDNITDKMRKEDIIIYPDIVSGNPLQFQNVVRWVLYFPGVIGGNKKYDSYEQIFAFEQDYYDNCPILAIPTIDDSLFYQDNTTKDIDCYFVHKGGKWKNIPEFKNMVEINTNFPKTREELASLLRRTKTLYSYDKYTLLLDEAYKCGCNVKIITKDGYKDYISNYDKRHKDYLKQIDNFIQITQNMQYKGKIAPISLNYRLNSLKFKLIHFVYKYILHNKKRALRNLYKSKGMLP